jgi:nitroreductase
MELSEVRRRRRMVRRYDPDIDVPGDVLERILAAGLRVPSAGFTQGVSLLVLDGADKDHCWAVTTDPAVEPDRWLVGMRTAPVLVLVWTDPEAYLDRYAEPDKGWTDRDPAHWTAPYWYVDAGMAALAMLYAAVDEGLGACFFGAPPATVPAIRSAYGVPEGHERVGVISLGTPAGTPGRSRRERRSAHELIHRGHWESETKVIS